MKKLIEKFTKGRLGYVNDKLTFIPDPNGDIMCSDKIGGHPTITQGSFDSNLYVCGIDDYDKDLKKIDLSKPMI